MIKLLTLINGAFTVPRVVPMLGRMVLLGALVAMTGCTTYHVRRADGTELRVQSMREFPNGIAVEYETQDGDKSSKLRIEAGATSNSIDANTLRMLAPLLIPALAAPTPAADKPAN